MVLYDLVISCECENVQLLTFGGPQYEWHLNIKCSKCGIKNDGEVYFRGDDLMDMPDSRGQCNFIMKCKSCKGQMAIGLAEKSNDSIQLTDKVKDKVLASFECRGGELVGWNAQGLRVQADSGVWFEDCDLTDTWVDYDESTSTNCMIDGLVVEFTRNKSKN